MNRETFERILAEEGIDDANLRADIWYSWYSRSADNLDERELRKAAEKFKKHLPELLMRQALNRAMDREFSRM